MVLFKIAKLVDRLTVVFMKPVELGSREPDHERCRPGVTPLAVAPAGNVPGPLGAAGPLAEWQLDRGSHFPHQLGVGLLLIPKIGIAFPLGVLAGQQARFDPAPRGGAPGLEFQGQVLYQHSSIRKFPGSRRTPVRQRGFPGLVLLEVRGDCQIVGGYCPIVPGGGIDGIRYHARLRFLFGDRNKQPGLTQPLGEGNRILGSLIPSETIKPTLAIELLVGNQQFAMVIFGKTGDAQGRVCQFALPKNFISIVLDGPNLAGLIIAIDIGSDQFGKLGSVIDEAPG